MQFSYSLSNVYTVKFIKLSVHQYLFDLVNIWFDVQNEFECFQENVMPPNGNVKISLLIPRVCSAHYSLEWKCKTFIVATPEFHSLSFKSWLYLFLYHLSMNPYAFGGYCLFPAKCYLFSSRGSCSLELCRIFAIRLTSLSQEF